MLIHFAEWTCLVAGATEVCNRLHPLQESLRRNLRDNLVRDIEYMLHVCQGLPADVSWPVQTLWAFLYRALALENPYRSLENSTRLDVAIRTEHWHSVYGQPTPMRIHFGTYAEWLRCVLESIHKALVELQHGRPVEPVSWTFWECDMMTES